MPVLFQSWIKREDLRRNQEVLYVFGDNFLRKGLGGQAKEMRGERNSVGITTKWSPHVAETAFFSDEEIKSISAVIDKDMQRLFKHVKSGGIVVWPADGIGTGLSELPIRAPMVQAYIEEKLASLIRAGKLFQLRAKMGV